MFVDECDKRRCPIAPTEILRAQEADLPVDLFSFLSAPLEFIWSPGEKAGGGISRAKLTSGLLLSPMTFGGKSGRRADFPADLRPAKALLQKCRLCASLPPR